MRGKFILPDRCALFIFIFLFFFLPVCKQILEQIQIITLNKIYCFTPFFLEVVLAACTCDTGWDSKKHLKGEACVSGFGGNHCWYHSGLSLLTKDGLAACETVF